MRHRPTLGRKTIPLSPLGRAEEVIKRSFRTAVIDGSEVTQWVKNCLAGQRLARQVHPGEFNRSTQRHLPERFLH
jgi:hypothetical protein